MKTTVYTIKQITHSKVNSIVFGVVGYVLGDEPTKVGYGLPALPTTNGFISKSDPDYIAYNDKKCKLLNYIVGAIRYTSKEVFIARIELIYKLIAFTDIDTTEIVIATDNSAFITVYKNYTEKSVEYLQKVKAGIEAGSESLVDVTVESVAEQINKFKTLLEERSVEVKFILKRETEEEVNYGIKVAETTAQWGHSIQREIPLTALSYLPHVESIDIPNIITDYPRAYFNSKLDALSTGTNEYYLTRISTDEEDLLGCRINDVSYCYLETKEPIEPINTAINHYRGLNHYTDLHITRIDINALKGKGQKFFTDHDLYRVKDNRKGSVPMGHMHGVVLLDPNDNIVINDIVPSGLSLVIADYFKEIMDIKEQVINNTYDTIPGSVIEVINLNDYFFDVIEKKTKKVFNLKKNFPNGSTEVKIVAYSNKLQRSISLPMFFGYDCYSRNALVRLAPELINFSLVLYERSPGDYRYATLVVTESQTAIIATCHANKLYLFSESL